MFPGETSSLTFTKILNGISHSLNIAKRVVPLYESVKPMFNNAKNAYQKLKGFNINKQITSSPDKKTITFNSNSPTFFK